MKYFGPQIQLPLQESGISPKIERSSSDDAELILGTPAEVLSFLKKTDSVIILFDATGALLRSLDKVILVGGHYLSGQEKEVLRARNIQLFSLQSIMQEGIANICDVLMESANTFPSVHICVSTSILDSQQFPGGLSARELLYFLQRLRVLKNYLTASVTGDASPLTAKLLSELAKPF